MLTRRKPLARRVGLRRISPKRQEQRYDYEQAVAAVHARAGGRCEVPGLVARHSTMPWATETLTESLCGGPLDPHHVWPQSRWPEYRCDPTKMILVCRSHHDQIHGNPRWSRPLGLLR